MNEIESVSSRGKSLPGEQIILTWNKYSEESFPFDQLDPRLVSLEDCSDLRRVLSIRAQAFSTIGEEIGELAGISDATPSVLYFSSLDSHQTRLWAIFIMEDVVKNIEEALKREFIFFINNPILWKGNALCSSERLTDDEWDIALEKGQLKDEYAQVVEIRRSKSFGDSAAEGAWATMVVLRKLLEGEFPADRLDMLIKLRFLFIHHRRLAYESAQGEKMQRVVPLIWNSLRHYRNRYMGPYASAFKYDFHFFNEPKI